MIFLSCVSGAIQKGRNAAKLIGLRCDKAYGQKQYIVMRNRQSCLCKWQPENAEKCVINQSTRQLMDWGSRGKSGVNGLKRNNWLFETFLQYCHAVAHQRPMKFIEVILNLWAIMNRIHFVSLDLIYFSEAYRNQWSLLPAKLSLSFYRNIVWAKEFDWWKNCLNEMLPQNVICQS